MSKQYPVTFGHETDCTCIKCETGRKWIKTYNEVSKNRDERMVENPDSLFKGHPRFHELLDKERQLHSEKNSDYTDGMREGPLGNFYRSSVIKKLYPDMDWSTPFGIAMSYMLKQLDAALVLKSTRRTSKTGEPVSSRLFDVSVYAKIAIILDEEENEVEGHAPKGAEG